jgi:hypothetical protein
MIHRTGHANMRPLPQILILDKLSPPGGKACVFNPIQVESSDVYYEKPSSPRGHGTIRDEAPATVSGYKTCLRADPTPIPIPIHTYGQQAQTFLAALSRRVGGSVPFALLDHATWATPRFAPFARMALGVAVRRGLAAQLHATWRRFGSAADARAFCDRGREAEGDEGGEGDV